MTALVLADNIVKFYNGFGCLHTKGGLLDDAAAQARFITVEGGEGVGKSLFTANFAKAIASLGFKLVVTREPGGTPTADLIRGLFAKPSPADPLLMPAEALLVSAARAQHVGRVVQPALSRGDWVLSDRFADSTRVYQGALGGIGAKDLEQMILFSTGGLEPDLTFLLDCDVSTAQARLARRVTSRPGAVERYDEESAGFHQRLRDAYLTLAKRDGTRIVVVDAALPPESMCANAFAVVRSRFGQ